MQQRNSQHNFKTLWILVIAAVGFGSFLNFQFKLTGNTELDGLLGVLLGLYLFPARGQRFEYFALRGASPMAAITKSIQRLLAGIKFVGLTERIDFNRGWDDPVFQPSTLNGYQKPATIFNNQ